MGQTDSKLGTGLKSTGGSFRRESVQAHPVLVYTNFLTGPYNENPEQAFPGSGNLKPDDDAMRKAQRRIKELETEVDILKQAAVYFGKNSK